MHLRHSEQPVNIFSQTSPIDNHSAFEPDNVRSISTDDVVSTSSVVSAVATGNFDNANNNHAAVEQSFVMHDVKVLDSHSGTETINDRASSPLRRSESGISITRHLPYGRVTSDKLGQAQYATLLKQSMFAPITNRVCNYASLYNSLIISDVVSTQLVTSYPAIPKSRMMLEDVNDIADDAIFQIGFARKDCTYTPITHASLAFRNTDSGKFLIVGRQNPQFLKSNVNESDPSFTWWAVSNIANPLTIFRFTTTHMDNEMKYNFFPGASFNAEMTDAFMSGVEIKKLIRDVNKNICLDQRYDVVHSNCYSAVSYGLAKAFEMIANKPLSATLNDEEIAEDTTRKNKELKRVFTLICHALQDNYKMGSGSVNNSVVNDAIQNTIDILSERKLLHIIDKAIPIYPERKMLELGTL